MIVRQAFSNSPKYSILSPPYHKVLETVCFNCKLGETPLSKLEYIKMTQRITKNTNTLGDYNIAHILRSLADIFMKEKRLLNFMEHELGFIVEQRLFKNSSKIVQ